MQNERSFNLKIKGEYTVSEYRNRNFIAQGKDLNTTVICSENNILLAGRRQRSRKLVISAKDDNSILIDGRTFKGAIIIIREKSDTFTVVNAIELEDYVKGILYQESSHYWPMEALKVQAIVSRTYALYMTQVNKDRDYDLTNTVYSQLYGGSSSERYRTNIAVEKTRGVVLTYRGKVFPAYFHASCGGYTEDASVLWNINIRPLKGVVCGFCRESPHYKWHYVLSLFQIRQKLKSKGYSISQINDIVLVDRDVSGRVKELKLVFTKNNFLKISAKDFREIIDPNGIRSTNFTLQIVGEDAVFEGFGWGHGVGLCQWGAYFMAKQGLDAEKILAYYYPGSDVIHIGF
ncbi:MAG: SpoIID/LytB domain-containing protein [Candidatus Omnitrophica bacterium]|nr:SpoIID/LytB domain-containing protein [Candidatus Omnitrophota bacterium]